MVGIESIEVAPQKTELDRSIQKIEQEQIDLRKLKKNHQQVLAKYIRSAFWEYGLPGLVPRYLNYCRWQLGNLAKLAALRLWRWLVYQRRIK